MERNAYFDNAKLVLITLVVFGHLIQPFVHQSPSIETLYTWIYTFHMPAFIFLAGFFAKGIGKLGYIFNLVKKLIIPYIVFQLIYTGYYFWLGKSTWLTEHLFHPHWSLWFLFSLFCWHILLIGYRKLTPTLGIAIAILLGVGIGYFEQFGHSFSISRTFVFFPYFLIGYWVSVRQLQWLKGTVTKALSIVVMVFVAVIIFKMPEIDIGWLLASKSYSTLDIGAFGGVIRLIVYAASILMAAAVLAWVPNRRFRVTPLGERTLYVYLLHGFIIQYIRENDFLQLNSLLDFVGIVLLSAAIVLFLSSKLIVSICQPLVEFSGQYLKRWFQKKNKPTAFNSEP